jgi:hypothetical protein
MKLKSMIVFELLYLNNNSSNSSLTYRNFFRTQNIANSFNQPGTELDQQPHAG